MREQLELGSITVLVVDDDQAVRKGCEALVSAMGIDAVSAASAREGLALMERRQIDVVLTDLRMPGMDGLAFMDALRKANPGVYVVLMSGAGSIESAVEAMKKGAFDFITKPFRSSELRQVLERIKYNRVSIDSARQLREEAEQLDAVSLLLGNSPGMQQINRVSMRAANSSSPALILGGPGTRKELLARAIHLASKNCGLPFVPVDCCSLMPELLESELFGYAKGSFQGATTDKLGLLANPECGTVFLHEAADLPLDLQAKLVRAIETRSVRPFGSTKSAPLMVRIVASSSRDLADAVARGKFRQDLYHRLSVLVLRLPSLVDRKEDIPLLVEYFLRNMSKETGIEKTVSPEVLHAFATHDWPGNLRELESVLERAWTLTNGTLIALTDVPDQIANKSHARRGQREHPKLLLSEIERANVLRAIEDTGGDKQKAAQLLGISRTTLYRKLNEYKRSG